MGGESGGNGGGAGGGAGGGEKGLVMLVALVRFDGGSMGGKGGR